MRLIDADALKEKLPPVFIEASCRDCPVVRGFVGLGNLINDAPTVDAVEVVRCRECKHANTYNIPKWSDGVICKYWSEEADRTIDVPKNGYCFCGERKEK